VGAVVTFDSEDQDIWGAAADGDSWQLINAEWDENGSTIQTTEFVGDIGFTFDGNGCDDDFFYCINNAHEFVSFDTDTSTIGFGANYSVAGHIRLDAETADIEGTASVTYPGEAGVEYPSADSFLAGQTVGILGSWVLLPGAAINANESSGDLRLIGDFRVAAALEVTAYYPSDDDLSDSATATIFDFDGSDEVTLFSLSAFEETPAVPPLPLLGFGGNIKPFSVTPGIQSAGP